MSAKDWALNILGGTSRGREVVCDCLFCGKASHMYVNGYTGLAYCFVCGAGANLAQLIAELEGVDDDYAYVKAERILDGEVSTRVTSAQIAAAYMRLLNTNAPQEEVVNLKLPTGCVPITSAKASKARTYLHSRKFNAKHWARYNLMFCVDPQEQEHKRFRNHIIFPNTDVHGRVTFYTSRAAYEPGKKFPKSYHPGGAKRRGILFGEFALRESVRRGDTPLFVVEGPLDMIALSGYAVALVGKFMSDEQAQAIAKYKRVVVALDAGESKDATYACKLLRAAGVADVRVCDEYTQHAKDAGGMAALGTARAIRTIYLRSKRFDSSMRLRAILGASL